ncbi:MAG: hypothetical protein ACYTEQ_25610 [Planctomycetota bacterium]|jgi:hypothetical protein
MKYSKIVAAVREYDRQMALLDAKETQLLKRGTETAVKNCEKDQRLAWDALKAKIDAGTDRGMTWIRHVIRGCRNTPECGAHPGTPWLCAFVVIGAAAAGWTGALGMLAAIGPFYLYGAYARSRKG